MQPGKQNSAGGHIGGLGKVFSLRRVPSTPLACSKFHRTSNSAHRFGQTVLSARTVSMGNARGAFKDRGNDVYETPAVAVKPLLRVEQLQLPPHIWEPCCGSGCIVQVLRGHGYCVTASDLIGHRIDFLMECHAPDGVGAIVTNPPYKLASDFIRQGLRLVPTVVMLLRLNFLEGMGRSDLINGGGLARVLVFANRLPRMHRAGWTGPRSSSTTAYAWFVWHRGHADPPTLHQIRWIK
jgi:hypothetical protein